MQLEIKVSFIYTKSRMSLEPFQSSSTSSISLCTATDRSDGFDACDEVLTTDEGLNSWMDGVVEKIDHLPDTPERPLLVVSVQLSLQYSGIDCNISCVALDSEFIVKITACRLRMKGILTDYYTVLSKLLTDPSILPRALARW